MILPPNYATQIRAILERANLAPLAGGRPVTGPLAAYAVARLGFVHPHASLAPVELSVPVDLSAANGSRLAVAAWSALAIHSAVDAGPIFAALAATRRGAFLTPTRSDNLESWWYHELVLLHAFTSYALMMNSAGLLDRARRAAVYHLNETQPDHATTEPWALNAFLLAPETYPLVDQLLHTLQTQHPGGPDPVSAILLTDTLVGFSKLMA